MSASAEAGIVLRVQRVLRQYHALKRQAAAADLGGETALFLLLMGNEATPLKNLYGIACFGSSVSDVVGRLLRRGYIETVGHGEHSPDRRQHLVRRTLLGKEFAMKLVERLGTMNTDA